jgi:hypothetical protein
VAVGRRLGLDLCEEAGKHQNIRNRIVSLLLHQITIRAHWMSQGDSEGGRDLAFHHGYVHCFHVWRQIHVPHLQPYEYCGWHCILYMRWWAVLESRMTIIRVTQKKCVN